MIWSNEDFFQLKKIIDIFSLINLKKKKATSTESQTNPISLNKGCGRCLSLPWDQAQLTETTLQTCYGYIPSLSIHFKHPHKQTDQPTHEVSISLPRGCKLFVGDGRVFCLLACCLGVLWLLQFLLVKYTTTIKKKTDCYSMTSKKLLSPLQITFERILHFISCQSNSLSNTLKIQEATS